MLPLMKPARLSKYGCLVATIGRGRSLKYMSEVFLWAMCAEKQPRLDIFGVRPFCLSGPDSRHLSTNDARGRYGRCNFCHLSLPPIQPSIIFIYVIITIRGRGQASAILYTDSQLKTSCIKLTRARLN
jgi:hypothetical protein